MKDGEIDMKPFWEDAPAWANYLAMDKLGGAWMWYEKKPIIVMQSGEFDNVEGNDGMVEFAMLRGDEWESSLQERVQNASS